MFLPRAPSAGKIESLFGRILVVDIEESDNSDGDYNSERAGTYLKTPNKSGFRGKNKGCHHQWRDGFGGDR